MTDKSLTDIHENLLSYLRSEIDNQQLTYKSLPTPVTGGFDTRIFSFKLKGASNELSRPLILRLFKVSSQNRAIFESAVQNAVVDAGYPVPRVFFTCTDESVLGGSFMIMEFIHGQTMVNMPVENVPEMLAKIHLHLHSIDADSVRNSLEVAGIRQELYSIEDRLGWLVGQIESPSLEWLQPGLRWIVENRPEDPDRLVVCHGDFHPINILTKDGEVSGVVDWSSFLVCDPAYDIGITKVLVTVAALSIFPEVPKVYWVQFINRYYDYYQRECPVDPVHVEYYEAFRCLKALLEGAEGHAAFCQPETMRILSEYFEKITSVCLTLPANLLTS